MKTTILTLSLISLGLSTLLAQTGPGPGGPPDRDPAVTPMFPLPPEVQVLREELQALRADLHAARGELIESLGPDATREEVQAALAAWHEANAAAIAEVQTLAAEIREIVQASRPDRPVRPVQPPAVPDEILALRTELTDLRKELGESREAAVAGLTDPAEIRAAMLAWREANAEAIAAMNDLAAEIRAWFQANRPVRAGRDVGPAMTAMRERFQQNAGEMRQAREQLGAQLRGAATAEERQAIVEQFREDQRQLMQERKELRRQERLDGDIPGGARRPGG
jgi:DNA repair exonuclease SbcCD ATPase subunit